MALFIQVGVLYSVPLVKVLSTHDLKSDHYHYRKLTFWSPLEILNSELPNDLTICLHFINYSPEKEGTRKAYSHQLNDKSYLVIKLL